MLELTSAQRLPRSVAELQCSRQKRVLLVRQETILECENLIRTLDRSHVCEKRA
jgi:hypothetical protein